MVEFPRFVRKYVLVTSPVRLQIGIPDHEAFVNPYADREAVFDVLLGSTYLEPIEDVLEDLPVDVGYPFAGTAGMGEQMSELNELADAYESGEDIDVSRTQPQV